ncbi:voltage-gated potassium channel, partial [Rhodotorula diobovata]
MSAPASPTGVPPTPLDTVPLPHLLPEAGPSTSSDSGASCAEKDHVKHDEQLDGQDEHEHEQAEIDAAEEEIHQERQREVEEGGKAKGVSGWVARRLFKRRPARASGDQATPADGGGNDSLAVQPETRLLPIISGLACPFAVLLDIPGLTTPWYVKTQGDTIVDSKPNPVLLDVGQALCLALGVLANGALIFRFLEHRPRLTTWLAMICLTVGRLIRDAIAIASVTWFGVVHRFSDGFTYSDGFWLSVAAAAASLVCNFTLAFDLIRTKDFNKKGAGLTEKQRALVIVAMLFLLNMGVGALCYSYLISGLRFVDSLYFTQCIVTSVGFGDIVPETPGAKAFTMVYAPLGIINLAVVVAIARETIIEGFEASYRSRRDQLAQKARERKELIRKKQSAARERRRRAAEELGQHGEGLHSGVNDDGGPRQAESAPVFVPPPSRSALAQPLEPGPGALQRTATFSSTTTTTSVDQSFVSLRQQLRREQQQEFRIKLTIAVTQFLIFWLGGSAVYSLTEDGWSFYTGLYFSLVVFVTLGLGDYTPTSPAGRGFFIAWSIFGIASMTLLLSVLTESWSARYKSHVTEGGLKKAYRRLKASKGPQVGTDESPQQITDRLFERDGYSPLTTNEGVGPPVTARELPDKIVAAIKNFHSHARYFMLGRNGQPPAQLSSLLAAAEAFPDGIDQLIQRGGASLAETGAQGDTEHFLFLVSYEREMDLLLDSAEQLA